MSTSTLLIVTTLGWVGALGTVGAYGLVSSRRLDASSLRFQVINVVGAGMLTMSAFSHANWPSAASNLVWVFFGVQALVNKRSVWVPGMARSVRAGHRWALDVGRVLMTRPGSLYSAE